MPNSVSSLVKRSSLRLRKLDGQKDDDNLSTTSPATAIPAKETTEEKSLASIGLDNDLCGKSSLFYGHVQ